MVFGLAGCDGSKTKDESAKPAPDALAKPPELSKPTAALDQPAGEPAKQKPAPEVASKDEAAEDGAEDVEGDAPPEQAQPKKRASSKRDRGRKRASTSPKEESAKSDATEADRDEADGPVPLKVKRIQFAESIDSREPVDPEETFAGSEVDKLYAFVELSNETKQKSKIVVRFIPPSGSSSKVTLDVGDKARWRTWALRRGVKAVGTWTVVVSDAEGNEIGRRTFEVTE